MEQIVNAQISFARKLGVAMPALVISNDTNVSLQMAGSQVASAAQADKWLLARVDLHVYGVIGFRNESLVALIAFEWLFFLVDVCK